MDPACEDPDDYEDATGNTYYYVQGDSKNNYYDNSLKIIGSFNTVTLNVKVNKSRQRTSKRRRAHNDGSGASHSTRQRAPSQPEAQSSPGGSFSDSRVTIENLAIPLSQLRYMTYIMRQQHQRRTEKSTPNVTVDSD